MNRQNIDEKTDIRYTQQGAYYLPDLALPTEEGRPIGIWGAGVQWTSLPKAEAPTKPAGETGRMNNIRSRTTEIVNYDLIYG